MASSKRSTQPAMLRGRVRQARVRTFGARGAARFARALDLHPSTYRAYESDRTPPMPVLMRVSEVAGVDLRWLLTGGSGTTALRPSDRAILVRFADQLGRHERAAGALTALLDLLDDARPVIRREQKPAAGRDKPRPATHIPVLGRTAAGVPCFWKKGSRAVGLLDGLPRASAARATYRADLDTLHSDEASSPTCPARLLQVSRPVMFGDVSVSEFLSAPQVTRRYTGVFALRVDGDSMAPAVAHGDFVIVSPDEPPRDARPAIVQLRNQMGLVCKLFRRAGARVHLIPINNSFPVTRHAVDDVVWALAVLFRVRLTGGG